MNYKFDLEEWMKRFPSDVFSGSDHYKAKPVSGPLDICAVAHLRKLLQDHYDWGRKEWIDLFVWGKGEPENRAATKIGGLPYRPRDLEWPVDNGNKPLPFIAQFNFTDSKDLVDVPGDILLLFGIIHEGSFQSPDGDFESCHLEWQQLTNNPLMDASSVPQDLVWTPEPFHGYLVRVPNYPDAKLKSGAGLKTKYGKPILLGKEVWSSHSITSYVGTCIGTSLFGIQPYDTDAPGRSICALKSLGVGWEGMEYPWVNVRDPEDSESEWTKFSEWILSPSPYPYPKLEIVDGGAIFIRMNDDGSLKAHISYG